MEEIRTFIAIELPEGLRSAIAKVEEELRAQPWAKAVRWVPPQNLHLTLKFLGGVPAKWMEEVKAAVEGASQALAPFQVGLAGLGCFPSPRRPNVVWIGLEGEVEALTKLARAVEESLSSLGFAAEGRPFSAHLTIGRVNRDASSAERRALGGYIQAAKLPSLGRMEVGAVSVMRSDLHPSGARYTRLAAFPLSGSAGTREVERGALSG